MKKYAFTFEDGSPSYTAAPSVDDMYVEGQTYGGLTCREIPLDATDQEVLSVWYWGDGWKLRPPRPAQYSVWAEGVWIDPRPLSDLQAAKWAQIKRDRDEAEFAPFTYNAMEFDGDLNAQRRLGSYISVSKSALAAGDPFSAEFILADNTVVTLSAQDFVGIELAKVQAVAAAFAHATALRLQIEAATTVAEVDAVTW